VSTKGKVQKKGSFLKKNHLMFLKQKMPIKHFEIHFGEQIGAMG